ncbi:M67 family metallopeptidase [Paenibacillus wenxiniae]|uniref:M67 family metallopeptidase n=1 Tax=Paenibacillus wenxiniae TaxID=1636843 RepID=A0ABW4RJB1_9BACL
MKNLQFPIKNTTITICSYAWEQLIAHMQSSEHEEVCGILTGKKTDTTSIKIKNYHKIRNVATDSASTFILDPKEWIQYFYNETEMIGLFHSHPNTIPVPSIEDLQQLPKFASLLSVYLIGSKIYRPSSYQRSLLETVPVVPSELEFGLYDETVINEIYFQFPNSLSFPKLLNPIIPWVNGSSVCSYTIERANSYILKPAPLIVCS